MHDVPRESVAEHLGLSYKEEGPWDELDERLARMFLHYSILFSTFWRRHRFLLEHARYVYNLQDSSSQSSDSDSESWDSDDSSNNWRLNGTMSQGRPIPVPAPNTNKSVNGNGTRKIPSIIPGRYYEVPIQQPGYEHFECGTPMGRNAKRKFFNYPNAFSASAGSKWDDGRVMMRDHWSPLPKGVALAGVMEHGGRNRELDADEEWEDGGMAVDSWHKADVYRTGDREMLSNTRMVLLGLPGYRESIGIPPFCWQVFVYLNNYTWWFCMIRICTICSRAGKLYWRNNPACRRR